MGSQMQARILDRFRRGEVNTLVVTSVAEEGLDIPACNLVIVMDGFQLPSSYVQSRGRARSLKSAYIVFCPRSDAGQLQLVAKARIAELITRDACRDLRLAEICYGSYKGGDDSYAETLLGTGDMENPIVVPSTGASLSIYSALDVLNRYCASLPRDKYTDVARPSFRDAPSEAYGENVGVGYIYDLRLPIGSPLSLFYIRGV
jgi:endoribonuclease Dicer